MSEAKTAPIVAIKPLYLAREHGRAGKAIKTGRQAA